MANPVRDLWLGVFDPVLMANGVSTCVVGGSCCCSSGPITIRAATAPNAFDVSGATDGTDACFGSTYLPSSPFQVLRFSFLITDR